MLERLKWFVVLAGVVLGLTSAPCFAWLYDGGDPQHLAPVIREGGQPVWVAEPLKFSADAYATQFGVAAGRIIGTGSMGFNVYLADTLDNPSKSAIGTWKISPQESTLTYFYVQPQSPIKLQKDKLYFLVFAPNSNNFWGSISYSQSPGYYGLGTNDHGATWYTMSFPFAVRVDGYYVPEPSSIIVLLAGLSLVGLPALQRRRARA